MEPDIPKRTNAFIELFPSIGLCSWIGNSAAVLTRCWRGVVVSIKNRREISGLAGLAAHRLPDGRLPRGDLPGAQLEVPALDPPSTRQAPTLMRVAGDVS